MYPEVFAALGFRKADDIDSIDTMPGYIACRSEPQLVQQPTKILSRKEKRQERKTKMAELRAQKRQMKQRSNTKETHNLNKLENRMNDTSIKRDI